MSSLIFCFRCLKDLIDEWLMVLQYLDSLKWLRFLTFEISLGKKNEIWREVIRSLKLCEFVIVYVFMLMDSLWIENVFVSKWLIKCK